MVETQRESQGGAISLREPTNDYSSDFPLDETFHVLLARAVY